MKNIEQLIKKTEELIDCLMRTHNPTIKVYEVLLQRLKQIADDSSLNDFLEGYPTSSKIMDFGRYSLEQIKIWEELWSLAKRIRESN